MAEVAAVFRIRPDSLHRAIKRGQLSCEGKGRQKRISREGLWGSMVERARGASPETSNHYLVAAKGFSRWCHRTGRMVRDPLGFLSETNVETDLRHQRRILETDELNALLAATRENGVFRGLGGIDRSVLYAFAANTGLRASELASLRPSSFDLLGQQPTVTVQAAYSKHRKEDVQPMRADVARLMRDYLAARPARELVWPGGWVGSAAEMIRGDLAAAKIPYESGGKVFDFHALRHQFISEVVFSTPNPKEAQELARHSSITMTMDRYAHNRRAEIAKVLDRLPPLPDLKIDG